MNGAPTLDVFDPTRCAGPTARVADGQVLDLLNVSHAPDQVAAYAAAMAGGDRFPPVAVIRLGRWFVVADGHRRLSACRRLGVDPVTVELWTLDRLACDLAGQARVYWSEAARLVIRLPRSAADRRRVSAFVAATVAHWRRAFRSLARLRR